MFGLKSYFLSPSQNIWAFLETHWCQKLILLVISKNVYFYIHMVIVQNCISQYIHNFKIDTSFNPGRAVTLEGSIVMCRPQDPPFSDNFFISGDQPFQAFFQLQKSCFCLWKNCIFKHKFYRFWLNFSSWDTNFCKNSFPLTPVSRESLLLKTWTAHTYPFFSSTPGL